MRERPRPRCVLEALLGRDVRARRVPTSDVGRGPMFREGDVDLDVLLTRERRAPAPEPDEVDRLFGVVPA